MENDQEFTESTDSNIGFIVPDSQLDDEISQQNLITGLSSQKLQPSLRGENLILETKISSDFTMSERKAQTYFNSSSTNESENEEQGIPLVADTLSDTSDMSRHETDRNITVVDRKIIKDDMKPTEDTLSVPAPVKKIEHLQFSSKPMIVPETMDSYDEVAPTPDAFGSFPMVIPDSPCMDDKDEDDEEITFRLRPDCSTVDADYYLKAQASLEQSDNKAESQSLYLKLTPSQTDVLQISDSEDFITDHIVTENISETGVPSLKLRKVQAPIAESLAPPLLLEKPTLADKEMEGSEESISVFMRVRSGNTTPWKQKLILDDSDDFLPSAGHKSLTNKIEQKSSEKLAISVSSKDSQLKESQRKFQNKLNDVEEAESLKFGNSTKSGSVLIDKEKKHSHKRVAAVGEHREPACSTAHLEMQLSDDQSSLHVDENLTLSYDYDSEKNASCLNDQSIDKPSVSPKSVEFENHVVINPDQAVHPSQKCNPEKQYTARLSEDSCFDVTTKQIATGKNSASVTTIFEKLPDQSTLPSEKDCHTVTPPCTDVAFPSISVKSVAKVKHGKKSYFSQEADHDSKDSCQFTNNKNISDEHHSKADTGIYLDESTFVPHIGNKGELSVVDRTGDSSTVARDTSTSFSKGFIFSDSTSLRSSRSLDSYTFQGSQSQTIIEASHLLPLKRSHVTVPQRRRQIVKRMKKVWNKRVRPKLVEHKSSSTDDTSLAAQSRKPKSQIVRKKWTKSVKPEQSKLEQGPHKQQQQEGHLSVTEHKDLTSLQRKAKFNKPLDPPATKLTARSTLADPYSDKTQQLNKKEHTVVDDYTRLSKKSTSVILSGFSHGEPSEISREFSVSSEHDVEKTTVQRILTVTVVITEKTKTDIYNSKGLLIHQKENIVEVERTTLEPKVASEKITERAVSPMLSPSRSVSTVTTGDLADVSSSSLSRTCSSGSKVSNPSTDATSSSLSLPTPAQRQQTLDVQDKEIFHQEGVCQQGSDLPAVSSISILTSKVNQKRLSENSSTGQDLFSTPNQSIIDRADSQIGKVISSSNSTPNSHSLISPNVIINNPDHDGQTKTSLHQNVTISSELPTKNAMKTPVFASSEQQVHIVHGQKASPDEAVYENRHLEVPQKQEHGEKIVRKLSIKSDSPCDDSNNDEQITPNSSSKMYSKKRKLSHLSITGLKSNKQSEKAVKEKAKDEGGESTDIQSTGFSVHGVPPSTASGDSMKDTTNTVSLMSSAGYSYSPEISLQGGVGKDATKMVVLKDYKSKVMTGAKVMGRWKDGYFYPGILSKVDPSNKKFMVKFYDGSQSVVKGNEIILARELPVGQSVMVLTSNGFYEPGMVMGHSESREEEGSGNLVYHVERDDGVTSICEKRNIILSEDQAASLLSDEEMRISPDTFLSTAGKPADISLDNLVEGKRQPRSTRFSSNKEDQPSTSGLQPISVQSSVSNTESETCHSGRKRKMGPVATSTPTPKQICKERRRKESPLKKPVPNPLGGVVVSPSSTHKAPRKACVGRLFETSTPIKSNLFEGILFMLTCIEKSVEERVHENIILEGSSMETSTDDNPDVESETTPFVKEEIQSIIEKGGGKVINSFDEIVSIKNCYIVAAEHQRTLKYLQALAAGMTILSHQWILHSAAQNKLQGLKAYTLPAGVSLDKKKLIEGTKGCSELARQTIMVVSTNQDFIDVWTSILNIAHSLVVTRFPARASKNDPGVDVVVSDSTCPSNIVRRCQQLDVPLVSSEWVAQCLITGHLVDVKGHAKYKHDFSL